MESARQSLNRRSLLLASLGLRGQDWETQTS